MEERGLALRFLGLVRNEILGEVRRSNFNTILDEMYVKMENYEPILIILLVQFFFNSITCVLPAPASPSTKIVILSGMLFGLGFR